MGPGMMGRGGWGMGPGMMYDGWGMGRGMMGGCPMFGWDDDGKASTFVDGRLAFLKTELKITDTQKDAWDGYAKAFKSNLETMKSMHQLMQTSFDAKSPVERLQIRISAMESRLAALKEMQPALTKLHEALDTGQREIADDLLPVMGCMM